MKSEGLWLKSGWCGGSGNSGDGTDAITCTDKSLKHSNTKCTPLLLFHTIGIRQSWKNPQLSFWFHSKYLINASWVPHQYIQVLSIYWDDRQTIMHPVSLGLHSDVCTWHWLWGRWKVRGSETSAFTLFHQLRVSSKVKPDLGEERAQVSGKWTREGLTDTFQQQSIIVREICVEILPVIAYVLACMLENTFIEKRKLLYPYSQLLPGKWCYKFHEGPGHGISRLAKQVKGHPGSSQFNNHCLRDRDDWNISERTWTTPIQESKKMVPLGSLEIFSSL